ncbi:MAG: glycosyltransferase [Gemella sp.]|nr:glycosyltransferase [Gemella sp.]
MNIALFSDTYYPEINGVATSVFQLKKGLEKLGHKVYVFTTASPNSKSFDNEYRVFSVPFVLMKDRRASLPIYLKWLRIIKKLDIDIIHTHTEFSFGVLGMRIAKKLNIKHIHTYHTIYEDYIHYLKLPKNKHTVKFVQAASRLYCNKTTEIIAPSEKTKNLLEEYGITTKVSVIPTGVDLGKFTSINQEIISKLKEKFKISDKDVTMVSISRLSKEKRLEESVLNFAALSKKYNNLKLLIVGDGPYREELEILVGRLRLKDRVFFTGYVSWDEIQNYYALGNIFLSSSTSETQGLTYLEALAAKLYLLVKKDESLVGILEDINSCISFTSYEEFEAGYEVILRKIENRNAPIIDEKYSQEGYAKNIESIYKKYIVEK